MRENNFFFNLGESEKIMGESMEHFYKLKVNKREFERRTPILI